MCFFGRLDPFDYIEIVENIKLRYVLVLAFLIDDSIIHAQVRSGLYPY